MFDLQMNFSSPSSERAASASRLTGPLLAIVALAAAGFILKAAQAVILPLVIAWFLSCLFAPIVRFLVRHRVPVPLAAACVIVLVFGFFYLTGLFLYARSLAFIEQYPKYAGQFAQIVSSFTERFSLPAWASLDAVDWQSHIGRRLANFSGSFLAFAGNLVMVLVFLVFMLLGTPFFADKLRRALPDEQGQRVADMADSIAKQITRYLHAKLLLSTVSSVLVWLVLVIGRSDFPFTWAALAFLLSFIPNIGTVIATVPPVLMALVQFYPNGWAAAGILVALLVIHQLIGCLAEPLVMGDRLNLSPMTILLSLVFWGWLWGIAGALLAVPIAASVKILCENIAPLKPLSVLMGADRRPKESA